jgi:hypothetical protein
LEKQSTNELSYSEELDNAAWSVKDNLSISANATTSPDGTTNADKLVEDSSNNQHRVYRAISGNNKSFSFFAKAGERSWVAVLSDNGFTWFDIANGTVGTVASGATASITAFANGWFRCVVYNTHNSYGAMIQLALANNGTSYQGNGTSGAFVWGCQIEASSYPTSYIPTTSASATRVADACFKTGISSLIGQTEGVIFVDFVSQPTSTSQSHFWIKGTSGNEIGLYGNSQFIFYSSGGVSINGGNIVAGTRYKVAFAYKANDYVAYINGTQVGTDTSATVPTTSALYINSYSDFTEIQNKQVNQAILFPTRLTNAELASLTTI